MTRAQLRNDVTAAHVLRVLIRKLGRNRRRRLHQQSGWPRNVARQVREQRCTAMATCHAAARAVRTAHHAHGKLTHTAVWQLKQRVSRLSGIGERCDLHLRSIRRCARAVAVCCSSSGKQKAAALWRTVPLQRVPDSRCALKRRCSR